MINRWKSLTISQKTSLVGVWLGSKYTLGSHNEINVMNLVFLLLTFIKYLSTALIIQSKLMIACSIYLHCYGASTVVTLL